DAGGARQLPQGGDREVVADHQGREHQAGLIADGASRMRTFWIALALALFVQVAGAAAQSYPSRPVTIIVPVAAGGVTDIGARVVGERMRGALGQPVIVENVTGAGGTIGVTRLFRSAGDGYTLIVGQWSSHVGAGAMYSLPFDYLNDFEPVSLI